MLVEINLSHFFHFIRLILYIQRRRSWYFFFFRLWIDLKKEMENNEWMWKGEKGTTSFPNLSSLIWFAYLSLHAGHYQHKKREGTILVVTAIIIIRNGRQCTNVLLTHRFINYNTSPTIPVLYTDNLSNNSLPIFRTVFSTYIFWVDHWN